MVKERSETNGQNRAKTVLVIGGGPGGYVAAIRAAQSRTFARQAQRLQRLLGSTKGRRIGCGATQNAHHMH